jgi:hypothetical protein
MKMEGGKEKYFEFFQATIEIRHYDLVACPMFW